MKMKHYIVAAALAMLGVGAFAPFAVHAEDCSGATDCMTQAVNKTGGSQNTTSLPDFMKKIANALLFVLGAIAVIMIIIGGIKYVTSQGDSSAVTSAKNTILYSVIGLIVAILAYAIVNFVINSFAPDSKTTTDSKAKQQ